MLKTILSIAGKPGLYKLISQGKNMLIVETVDAAKKPRARQRTPRTYPPSSGAFLKSVNHS